MSDSNKGFGSMPKEKVKEIASKGGQASGHNKGHDRDDKDHDGRKNNGGQNKTSDTKDNKNTKDHDGRKDNGGHSTAKK